MIIYHLSSRTMKAFGCFLLLLTTFLTLIDASEDKLRKSTSQQQRQDEERLLRPLIVWERITFDDFESGRWGTFTDGGSDADLRKDSRTAHSGDYSARIRDDSETQSSIYHTQFKDVSAYSLLRVHFWYYPKGMKDKRGFVVEYSTDNSWQVLQRFEVGVQFASNSLFYEGYLEFSSEDMSQIKLRFRCDGKDDTYQIHLDEINFEGALDGVCPLDRLYPPAKYEILPLTDTKSDNVDDDLAEISSLAFSSQTDAQGSKFAYVVSDKNQFSLKVIKFTEDPVTANFLAGSAVTVAIYKLNVTFGNDDWEDISLGPCSDDITDVDHNCIFVGNFGNNNRGGGYVQRDILKIFKFPEPSFVAGSPPQILDSIPVATIRYSYASPFTQGRFFDGTCLPRHVFNETTIALNCFLRCLICLNIFCV
jgi:hypothetical protein